MKEPFIYTCYSVLVVLVCTTIDYATLQKKILPVIVQHDEEGGGEEDDLISLIYFLL